MSLDKIKILDSDIEYAEDILLWKGYKFNKERREFIKNLDTIELEAVPWSWKTTALIAKLLILSRKKQIKDWAWVLLLSHTNIAVDEIKNKLWRIAPNLFKFPNFIWTIQSFVDEFLAKPYWINYLGINFEHIDTEYYESYCYSPKKIIWWISRRAFDKDRIIKKSRLVNWKLIYCDWWTFPLKDVDWYTYRVLVEMKESVLCRWIIAYDEAYYYWEQYLELFPKIKKIIQNRFKFVFVDEMQDMTSIQKWILDKIFLEKYVLNHCYQKIWDTNQAIFTEDWSWEEVEEKNKNTEAIQLNWSHRLTSANSNVINNFSLHENKIIWYRKLFIDWKIVKDIKPILIVYENKHLNTLESVWNKIIDYYIKIIKELDQMWIFNDVKEKGKFICKAIIAHANWQDEWYKIENRRMYHYFDNYCNTEGKIKYKKYFKTYKDYLFYFDEKQEWLKNKYNNLINLHLRILRELSIMNSLNGKHYNKISLIKYLKNSWRENYKTFLINIYKIAKKIEKDIDVINSLLPEVENHFRFFFTIFNITPPSKIFIWDNNKLSWMSEENINWEINTYKIPSYDWKITIWTVHSVKWETHTCTLYMDSIFHSHESDKLKDCIIWNPHNFVDMKNGETKKNFKLKAKSLKLMYVWFSRPTHLLCYSIWKEKYQKIIEWVWKSEKLNKLWDVRFMD